MKKWINFFLGTPQRFLCTVAGIGVVICAINPTILVVALCNLRDAVLRGLGPLLGPVLAIVIVFAGLKMIFSGIGGKKK